MRPRVEVLLRPCDDQLLGGDAEGALHIAAEFSGEVLDGPGQVRVGVLDLDEPWPSMKTVKPYTSDTVESVIPLLRCS